VNTCRLEAAVLAAVVAAVAARAKAEVVAVSPENMQGWVIATTHGAKANLVASGPAAYEREYYAYNAHIPTGTANPKHWSSWTLWWTYPKQLIQLQVTALSPDGTHRKQFWFMPWQKVKIRGENGGRHCKKWLRYDAVRFNVPVPSCAAAGSPTARRLSGPASAT